MPAPVATKDTTFKMVPVSTLRQIKILLLMTDAKFGIGLTINASPAPRIGTSRMEFVPKSLLNVKLMIVPPDCAFPVMEDMISSTVLVCTLLQTMLPQLMLAAKLGLMASAKNALIILPSILMEFAQPFQINARLTLASVAQVAIMDMPS